MLTAPEGNAVHSFHLAKRTIACLLGGVWGKRKARALLCLMEPCARPASVSATRCVTHTRGAFHPLWT